MRFYCDFSVIRIDRDNRRIYCILLYFSKSLKFAAILVILAAISIVVHCISVYWYVLILLTLSFTDIHTDIDIYSLNLDA